MTRKQKQAQEIRELQNMLRTITEAGDDIPLVNPDGIFGARTEEAVLAFQRGARLAETGIVDYATWQAITRAYRNASRILSHRPIHPFPSPDYEIRSGEKTDVVMLVQIMLSALAIALDTFDGIRPTGVYDEQTEKSITEFQRTHDLVPNGVIDRKTWDALAKAYDSIVGNTLYSD